MAHGHLIDSGQWDTQFTAFAQEFRVVRYDARGFGRSDKPAQPFAFHEDLRALLAFMRIERSVLMGCSGGGATVIDLALAYPDLARGLVLVGTAVSGYQLSGAPPPKIVKAHHPRRRAPSEHGTPRRVQQGGALVPEVDPRLSLDPGPQSQGVSAIKRTLAERMFG